MEPWSETKYMMTPKKLTGDVMTVKYRAIFRFPILSDFEPSGSQTLVDYHTDH